jgi:hypothetical protein
MKKHLKQTLLFQSHSKKIHVKISNVQSKMKFIMNFHFQFQNLLINIGECKSRSKHTNMIYKS